MAYVYYSYEQWGRGYIGARNKSPVNDPYLGTYSDTTFAPTDKIVLAEFDTFEEALEAECALHAFFDVASNSHFANRAQQTSTGWLYTRGRGAWSEEEKQRATGKKRSLETRRKMSESAKTRFDDGARSQALKRSLRESGIRKGRQWATNGVEQRMLAAGEPMPDGWWSGRLTFNRRRRK